MTQRFNNFININRENISRYNHSTTEKVIPRLNNISDISKLIIGTEKIFVTQEEKDEVKKKAMIRKKEEQQITNNAWNERNNEPYKNVNDEKLLKKFIGRKKIDPKELIDHIVDKEKEGKETKEKYKILVDEILLHNNTLKKIYASEEKENHYKNFEHSNKYGKGNFEIVKFDDLIDREGNKQKEKEKEKENEGIMSFVKNISVDNTPSSSILSQGIVIPEKKENFIVIENVQNTGNQTIFQFPKAQEKKPDSKSIELKQRIRNTIVFNNSGNSGSSVISVMRAPEIKKQPIVNNLVIKFN